MEFFVIFLSLTCPRLKRWFFSLFENRAISNMGRHACRTIVTQTVLVWLRGLTTFNQACTLSCNYCVLQCRWVTWICPARPTCLVTSKPGWLDRSDDIDFEVQSAVWAPHSPDWKDGKILKRAHCVRSIGDKNFSQTEFKVRKRSRFAADKHFCRAAEGERFWKAEKSWDGTFNI